MSDALPGISLNVLARALRLVTEVRDLPRASVEQRARFLAGLTELIGARVGISVRFSGFISGVAGLSDPLDIGWDSARERAIFHSYLQSQASSPDPTLPRLLRVAEPVFARTRSDFADDRTWYRSDHVQELRRNADVDHCILAGRRFGDVGEAFSLHRPWGDRAFSSDDAQVVEVVYRSLLPHMTAPEPLPPRLDKVLDGLCRGLSEKQVAAELELSAHTVHGYIKELHRRFGVRSRSELMVKALSRL